MPDLPSENPYQSPALLADEEAIVAEMAVKDRLLLRKCQQQMVGLGYFWIAIGFMGLVITALFEPPLTAESDPSLVPYVLSSLMLAVSILHLVIGVLSCFKRLSAAYIGLILGYITAFATLLTLSLIPFLLVGIGLLLAHRVLRWAKELKARGIPLTTSAELPP